MCALRKRPPSPPVAAPPAPDLDGIVERLRERGREFDRDLLERVWQYSAEMHSGQTRRSGAPYLTHPASVAWILADLRLDETSVVVGLLHDVLEDTLTTREDLDGRFGAEIGELVDGVTKIGRHLYVRRDEAQAETFRKMILASAKDIRVVLVKLADRLHNMMTLDAMTAESKRRISQETLEIYAPIAHRLGMAKVKGDLEDLAFFYLYPLQFATLHAKVQEKIRVGKRQTREIADRLRESLAESGLESEISFRVKRYYSIFQKLRRQDVDVAELYDYLAFRIVAPEVKDCYAALGVVHQNWRPIPGRFKDYIAMPKPNLYQSLHTTVLGSGGQPFEVQIRTREMDLVAEEGIAAHWRYKEGKERTPVGLDENVRWLRQLLDLQTDSSDPRTFLSSLKLDLYPDEVYLFSPKGDVFAFPRGATPLDFAYRIHTDLGHHCNGARVNGRLVPLRTPLRTGDVVEISTHATRRPSRDWLNLVITSKAKTKIRQWLNAQQAEQATEVGRKMLEKELSRLRVGAKELYSSARFRDYLQEQGLVRPEDLLARVGYGKATVAHVLESVLAPEQISTPPAEPGRLRRAFQRLVEGRVGGPVLVRGENDVLFVLAQCCRPVPGDEIVGYVTRGRGISVHAVDCPNVRNLLYNPEREIEVAWASERKELYSVSLVLSTEDRQGMLARLTDVIAKLDTNIRQIEADTERPGRGNIVVVVEVRDRAHLEKVRNALRDLPGVLEVRRQMTGTGARSAESS